MFCILVLPLSGCMTDAQLQEALFGPSESEKQLSETYARLDAENAQREYAIASVELAVFLYQEASPSVQLTPWHHPELLRARPPLIDQDATLAEHLLRVS